jgi:tricorn protease-like protein
MKELRRAVFPVLVRTIPYGTARSGPLSLGLRRVTMITRESFNRVHTGAILALLAVCLFASNGCFLFDEDPSGPEGPPQLHTDDAYVDIDEPAFSTYLVGEPVPFKGQLMNEREPFPEEYFIWTSSIQGELGTGREFTRADLVEGNHLITLTVRDNAGLTKKASKEIAIVPPSPDDCSEFTLSVSPETIHVVAGGEGYAYILITPIGGFTGQVELGFVETDDRRVMQTKSLDQVQGKPDYELDFRATSDPALAQSGNTYAFTLRGRSARSRCEATFRVQFGSSGQLAGLIAFESERDGNKEIYVMSPDGSAVQRLTNHPEVDVNASWSPDGTQIVFASERDGDDEIYVMNADGSSKTQLTHNKVNDWNPAWSPDGRTIAFRSERDGNSEIYVMNADGSGVTRLTDNPATDAEPTWSHDGSLIAFVSDRDGNDEIYVMNADGSGQTNVTKNVANDVEPAWSPVADRIAFASDRDGNEEIYVMNADGSGQTNVTKNNAEDDDPTWS